MLTRLNILCTKQKRTMSVRFSHIMLVPCIILYNFWSSVAIETIEFKRERLGITNITNYTSEIASDTQDISFPHNEISLVPWQYFTNLNLSSLERIDLGYNRITKLDDNWLSGLSSLDDLDLNDNNLKVIRNRTFSGIINLTHLRLDGNRIESIQCGAFQDLINLQRLKLYKNQLPTIHECIFNVEAQPTSLKMWLDDNPWVCNEELSWVIMGRGIWITLRDNHGDVGECGSPCNLAGCYLTALTTDDLKSTPKYG